ncbi:ubiquitin-related domain-containing protein [Amylostereum chailletii]|nr:ubiquitin-related domain-containing protein [Amylostereum chailletii]
MSDKDTLISMGFDLARVEWALKATNNRGLQPAMDFILEHNDDPVPEPGSQSSSSGAGLPQGEPMDEDEDAEALRAAYGKASANVASGGADVEAKSIKCAECGKIFKNTALANFHAEKSGHDQFEESTEEIKPLTEEEKKQKLQELKEKMAKKRSVKAVEEAKEAKANEIIRRKAGQDLGQAQEDLKAKQLAKDIAAKKREKDEDARARAAIKAQIEADKKARAEKAAREKALRDGTAVPTPSSSSTPAAAAVAAPTVAGRDFKETRLQIRMASGGQPYTTTLSSDATLREVAEFLAGQVLAVDVETVNFAQHFPRKQFTHADFARTLRELGLTPSAVLIAS